MDPFLTLILVGLFYILAIGGLAALRREGFSLQFAVEALVAGGLLLGLAYLFGWAVHPVALLVWLYLVTMRSRLIVDVANLLAGRGRHAQAAALYRFALRLRPDQPGRQIVLLNQGIHRLKQGNVDQAAVALQDLLAQYPDSLAPKFEAAARYNLGVAYQRQGIEAKAVAEFNKVADVMPGSVYAMGARKALERARRRTGAPADSPEAETADE